MYCPQCKAEYRQGFTRCADCDVDLVHEPPPSARGWDAVGQPGSHAEDSEDPFCSFWRGEDPRVHAELCELLNEEGIPHKTIRREDHLFNLNTRSGFEIGIPFSQFEKAEAAVKNAYGTEKEKKDVTGLLPYGIGYGAELDEAFPWQPSSKGFARAEEEQDAEVESQEPPYLEQDGSVVESRAGRAGWDREDWNPEEATLRVWSSAEAYPGEIIEMALRENQIHARFEKAEGKNTVFVQPGDGARAREIVREIVEGAPPE
jgi:hypothetical protein